VVVVYHLAFSLTPITPPPPFPFPPEAIHSCVLSLPELLGFCLFVCLFVLF
jgi:hypothetical protein